LTGLCLSRGNRKPEIRESRFYLWGRCYDFKNIFAKKFGENIGGFFLLKLQLVLEKMYHDIGFEKNAIFGRKLAKIAENCDHNINP
jgi:hypothetical protein